MVSWLVCRTNVCSQPTSQSSRNDYPSAPVMSRLHVEAVVFVSRATRRAPVGWHSLRPRFGPLQKSIALRSACVPIGFGLVCTRTNAPQARTDRPGSQKCPKWPLGKVLPRPFTFNLAVPFRAFTRSVAAFLHWFHTPPALKTILSPQDLYEVIKFQISIFGCARSSEQLQGPWPNRANFENACNAES